MAKDSIHTSIRRSLENDGWHIKQDPFTVDLPDDDTFFDIDLAAEREIAPNKIAESIIAIEIKSFIGGSVLNGFHEALGQFLNYKAVLHERNMDIELFLAVSTEGWKRLSSINFIQRRIQQYQLQFIIVDIEFNQIEQWIK